MSEFWKNFCFGFFVGFLVCDVLDRIIARSQERLRRINEYLDARGVREHLEHLAELQRQHADEGGGEKERHQEEEEARA